MVLVMVGAAGMAFASRARDFSVLDSSRWLQNGLTAGHS